MADPRLSLAFGFAAAAVLAGCGLNRAGEAASGDDAGVLADDAAVDEDSADPARDARPTMSDASDGALPADDAESPPGDDDASPEVDAGQGGEDAHTGNGRDASGADPCTALKPCCDQVIMLSPSATGCYTAVKSDEPTTCQTLLTDFESSGLCR